MFEEIADCSHNENKMRKNILFEVHIDMVYIIISHFVATLPWLTTMQRIGLLSIMYLVTVAEHL